MVEKNNTNTMKNKYKRLTTSEILVGWVANIVMFIAIIGCLYPIIYTFSASLSSGIAIDRQEVILFPVDFTIGAYEYLFSDSEFWIAFLNSLFYMFFSTLFLMFITVSVAFVLARKDFIFHKQLNFFILLTMWFGAGTIPQYLNYMELGINDSRWGMVIGFGLSAFNILLVRNYFETLPEELSEAARIDGGTESQLLRYIYLPLSKAIIATVTLFYALDSWNSWFWFSLLIKTDSKQPLQIILRRMLLASVEDPESTQNYIVEVVAGAHSSATIEYAVMVLSLIPVLIIYPMVQKHFTKGITLGGVKG